MKKINVELEEQLYCAAQEILEEYGLDVEDIIKSTLKRVVKQGSAEFVFAKASVATSLDTPTVKAVADDVKYMPALSTPATLASSKITKNIAKSYFTKRGHVFDAPVVFSSRNKATGDYWANPSIDTVRGKWYLILNDQYQRILRLFLIDCERGVEFVDVGVYRPSNEHAKQTLNNMRRLVPRADKRDVINLQIFGDDIILFTDKISGVEFRPYLIDEVNY